MKTRQEMGPAYALSYAVTVGVLLCLAARFLKGAILGTLILEFLCLYILWEDEDLSPKQQCLWSAGVLLFPPLLFLFLISRARDRARPYPEDQEDASSRTRT